MVVVEPTGGLTTCRGQCGAAIQTYGYLPSHLASPPFDQRQFILFADACEQLAQGGYPEVDRPVDEPATLRVASPKRQQLQR